MEATSQIVNIFYLVSIFISLGVDGVKIQAYRHSNLTGLIWTRNLTAHCNNIPRTDKFFIKTDACFIGYDGQNCQEHRNKKYIPGKEVTHEDIKYIYWGLESFHLCDEEKGGNQLNLDIIAENFHDYDMLESYKNVCSCVNVPQYVQNERMWYIDNHHNALLAYYEPDCTENMWESMLIPAGLNIAFAYMGELRKTNNVTNETYKAQSVGPDPNSKYFQHCLFAALNERPVLTNKLVQLQTQVEQSKQIQGNFQSELLKQHKADIDKLTDEIIQLKQVCQNVTQKIKSDLHNIFA